MEWGFYAHRKINYYAIFTVPPPLNQLFKKHIDYISEHAIDPDKRRYANTYEGWRHYIDLDSWMKEDSCVLQRNYFLDRAMTGNWSIKQGEEVHAVELCGFHSGQLHLMHDSYNLSLDSVGIALDFLEHYYHDQFSISDFITEEYTFEELIFEDNLLESGILPYYFLSGYHQLVKEMKGGSVSEVLQKCAELGHYISDAHVPLHTTSNYNGQATGQEGIHAFWETRIPELFAEGEFTHWVGKAEYIGNKVDFIWEIILSSHKLVDKVLNAEITARAQIDEMDHFCFEDRGSQFVRTQCPEFAKAYREAMGGMVEDRWKASIKAVGSIWYSAWLDAGEPELWGMETGLPLKDSSILNNMENVMKNGKFLGRDH